MSLFFIHCWSSRILHDDDDDDDVVCSLALLLTNLTNDDSH